MSKNNRDVIRNILEQIKYVETLKRHVDTAIHYLQQRNPHRQIDFGDFRASLFQAELDLYRELFMWALTVDEKEQARIRAAAHQRFIGDSKDVSRYMNPDGFTLDSWLSCDEHEFREMAKKAFAPKGGAQ
jgi:hypothetical protein